MEEQERKIRARLQSERMISKIARKKADQLAQRVVELETQLEIVHNQKKKAEKAAAKVLSILRDNGIEYSDEGASRTGQEEIWNSPCEGILSYSETTPEQTSGEENYVELFPKDADLCSPVEEGSEFDSGTNVNESEEDAEINRESEQEACYQSKEEGRENKEKVHGVAPSGSDEIRPEAVTTRMKAASSGRLAVEKKSLSYTLVEANISKENGQGFPKDRLDSGSTTSNRSTDHSPAERGPTPVHHVQETSGAAKAKGKQPVFLVGAASSPGIPSSSKLQTISQESSESQLPLRPAGSRGSTTSSGSMDEVERALKSLQLAKFSILSGVGKSSSCQGETIRENECCKRTEASVELPFISCADLFRLPPSVVHGAGTRNKYPLLPCSDLVSPGPAHGSQQNHHIFSNLGAPFSATKMQSHPQSVASTTLSSSLSHPCAQFSGFRYPCSDEQGRNPGR
ncbi:uncharacterized protein LOC116264982 isoform X2 [Nymphaea colorata]|uniref:uncharacterized protein LOC116264982 isoform X2 n=1 Tax=Nymphaea colorata TaxID=210225 RepID=UPI00129E39A3|nr:uncharacterized protein LOC116264982 isoform X2 [Nymphaea colorata]